VKLSLLTIVEMLYLDNASADKSNNYTMSQKIILIITALCNNLGICILHGSVVMRIRWGGK